MKTMSSKIAADAKYTNTITTTTEKKMWIILKTIQIVLINKSNVIMML